MAAGASRFWPPATRHKKGASRPLDCSRRLARLSVSLVAAPVAPPPPPEIPTLACLTLTPGLAAVSLAGGCAPGNGF